MAEYIEREVTCSDCFHVDVCENRFSWLDQEDNTKHRICHCFKNKADVVEVVRCKDCLYATERYGHLTCINGFSYRNHWNNPDDFCNHGVEGTVIRNDERRSTEPVKRYGV